jgi:hypothetical protein
MAWVSSRNARLATAALLAMLVATTPARSQQESVAESLFRQGREEMKRGEPALACPKFEESYRLDPSAGTLLNLGLCEAALGHTATAWTKLHQFLDVAPDGDARLRLARENIAKLETQLSWVQLVVDQSVEPLVVQLDDVELRDVSLSQAVPVNPGDHSVRVSLQSGESNETRFQIRAAEKLNVTVPLPSRRSLPESSFRPPLLTPTVEPPPSGTPARVAKRAPTPKNGNGERAVAYTLGAIGATGLVTSGIFGLLALRDKNVARAHCPHRECQDQTGLDAVQSGARNETVSTAAFVVGAVGVATGAALLWHAGRVTAGLAVGPNSATLALLGVIQ